MLQPLNVSEAEEVRIFDGFIPEIASVVEIADFDRGQSDELLDDNGTPRKMWIFRTKQISDIYLKWVEGQCVGRLCSCNDFTQLIAGGEDVHHCGSFIDAFREFHQKLNAEGKKLTRAEVKAAFVGKKVVVTPHKCYKVPFLKANETKAVKTGRKCYVYHIDLEGKPTEFPYTELLKRTYTTD